MKNLKRGLCMSDLNLKDHINSSLTGTGDTTSVPWRIADGVVTPNIYQPRHPDPGSVKARQWEKIMRDLETLNSRPSPSVVTPASIADRIIVDMPTSRNRTVRFNGITFTAYLADEVMEFFEDERNLTREELRLLEVAHPKAYSQIKQAWMTAWKELKALEAFEKD